jgi:hypothetical protein
VRHRDGKRVAAVWALTLIALTVSCVMGVLVINLGSISEPSIHSTATPVVAPSVQASERDESTYLAHLGARSARVLSDTNMVAIGREVCARFEGSDGWTYAEALSLVATRTGREHKWLAPVIVDASVTHLCPGVGL